MFTLQLGHPKITAQHFPEFSEVKQVFLSLFREEEESVYLFWNEIPLQFRYRQDLFANIDNIIALNWYLQQETTGKTSVKFSNQLLEMQWELYWTQGELIVKGHFHAHEELYQAYADALNASNEMTVSKQDFLQEWKTLLHQILVAFDAGNVQITDGQERRKLELLQRTEQTITGYGRLYTR